MYSLSFNPSLVDTKQVSRGNQKCFALLLQILNYLTLDTNKRNSFFEKRVKASFKKKVMDGVDMKSLLTKLLEVSWSAAESVSTDAQANEDEK